jgi:transposase
VSSKSLSYRGVVHLELDVSRDSIAVGVLRPEGRVADVEMIPHDEESVRRLVTRLGSPGRLWACYEAGPTGYGLHRLLGRLGVRCDVMAPSLIPRAPGDKFKTDRRDAKRLARLHRAGELTAIRVPSPAEEGVRDPLYKPFHMRTTLVGRPRVTWNRSVRF